MPTYDEEGVHYAPGECERDRIPCFQLWYQLPGEQYQIINLCSEAEGLALVRLLPEDTKYTLECSFTGHPEFGKVVAESKL